MPILLPEGLPATRELRGEGIEVASAQDAHGSYGPGLRIALPSIEYWS